MSPTELKAKIVELTALPVETEWVEFKQNDLGKAKYSDIGEYLSAISNSLALLKRDRGYIVWGVDNATHALVGSDFKPRLAKVGNEELENWLTRGLDPQIRFEIHETEFDDKRFVVFEICTTTHAPVRFMGDEYIRIGSLKKKLKDHKEKERELWAILSQGIGEDWSAGIVANATIADLDLAAINRARDEFKKKNASLAAEVDSWDAPTFLNKAKVCISGKITRSAIILLGKPESEVLISPAKAQITWVLKDDKGGDKDYAHFYPPLLLSSEAVFGKIRNLTYRYMKTSALFPDEVSRYDPWVIREALHNCIAHQDYSLYGRITVVEQDDHLLFTNVGSFLPKSVEAVIEQDSPPYVYRNQFLANAMVGLNMIDTIGSGIKRMFQKQRERLFPMPDYDLSEPQRVKVKITGKVLDENFAAVLLTQTELRLSTVISLDRVQKHLPIRDDEARELRDLKLIEGRKPNYVVSAKIAALTDTRAEYIKHRTLDKKHYKGLVVDYLQQFSEAKKKDIEEFMLDKLSESLTVKQKRDFVRNLLQEMRREGSILPDKARRGAKWRLANPSSGAGA